MSRFLSTFILFFCLVLVLSLSWYTWHLASELAHDNAPSRTPDAFITRASLIETNRDGVVYRQLKSPLFIQYPNKIIEAVLPCFSFFDQNAAWYLSAKKGKLKDDGHELQLLKDVKLQQFPFASNASIPPGFQHRSKDTKTGPALTVTTSELTFYPNAHYAVTQEPVTITQANHVIHAVGLRIETDKHRIELLAHVTSETQFDQQPPLFVQADFANYDDATKTSEYRGHVRATQGTTVVTADKAVAYLNAKRALEKIIAKGSPVRYRATEANKPEIVAVGDTVNYYFSSGLVEFVGHAKITQGKNSFSGQQLNYNLKQKSITSSAKQSRAHIVIQPE